MSLHANYEDMLDHLVLIPKQQIISQLIVVERLIVKLDKSLDEIEQQKLTLFLHG